MIFQAQDLTQFYEENQVFSNLSFQLTRGEHLGILGPSGCGKSTLLRILVGLDIPMAGDVFFQDKKITGQKGIIPFMGQEDFLLPWLTLEENISIPKRIKGLSQIQRVKELQELWEEFGLRGFEKYYPDQLSGGMRQRAALLRTFITNPLLMCLDEPFAALDAITRRRMQMWMNAVLEKENLTLIMVTHSIEEALLFSHKIIVMGPLGQGILQEIPIPFAEESFETKESLPDYQVLRKEILQTLEAVMSMESP